MRALRSPRPVATLPALDTVAYCRVSTEEQAREDRTSLQDQQDGIGRLAARLRRTVGEVFEDAGVSGGTAEDRPGFMALLAFCRAHPRPRRAPGYVLVLNDSRWGRFENPEEATYWRVDLEKHAGWVVRFAEADDTDDRTARGILRSLYSAQASAYREQIKANARRGVRNLARDRLRHWAVEQRAQPALEATAAKGDGWRSADDADEIQAAVERALEQLSPRQREIVLLRWHRGLTYEEIGTELGIATGTASAHMQRAIAALRRVLLPAMARTGARG